MKITIPELCLVALIGPSGSGKSTFARRHFKPTEVLSSDYCRGLVSDDENDQSATNDAFEVLHYVAGKRLRAGKLTVVDATNVQDTARKPIVDLAREFDCLPVAIVLNVSESICHERNKSRSDRNFGPHVIRSQCQQLRRSIRNLKREGFRQVHVLHDLEEIERLEIERVKLWNDRRGDHGPFDIIGDVHGCMVELGELLQKLGYSAAPDTGVPTHPDGRRAVFVGDLVDRGPDSPGVLRTVMAMVEAGTGICVPGNHDVKLLRKLMGRDVRITHGLAETLEQMEREPREFHEKVAAFVDGLVSHFVLDDGNLVVAHAGLKEAYQGRASGRVREFCLYGETTGETDEYGFPVRYDWASEYRGKATVVYGHTPVPEAQWLNRTICIDTGCVFGGNLTALRYPERELESVPAHHTYYEPTKPLLPPDQAAALAEKRPYNDVLDIEDVLGKKIIQTRILHNVTVLEQNGAAALEVMSRFAADPHWLIYLPPTMSPSETCEKGPHLEYPSDGFAHYRSRGVPRVICQEKHMGSRAVVVLCRDVDSARSRFGTKENRDGIIYTRTGRPFFQDPETESVCLGRLRSALDAADFWAELGTDWVCLDAELLPWSAKAEELIRSQYAAVGVAATTSLSRAEEAIAKALRRGVADPELAAIISERRRMVSGYIEAYRQYCWRVADPNDLKLAPFHVLATEGAVHTDRDHVWHMATIERLCQYDDGFLRKTRFKIVDLTDEKSEAEGTAWWEELTAAGGEGMVIKPLDWIVKGKKGLVQPALKCRGREYLRIIYGPEYSRPENLDRLRHRELRWKRSLALREFALGIEALHRFVQKEPLYRVHECVFGVLALESEPVDPRL